MTEGRAERGRARATLIGVTAVWGVTFPLNAVALHSVAGPTLTLLRFVVAAVTIGGFAAVRRQSLRPSAHELRVGGVTGGLLFAGYLTQIEGQRFVAPALAGFLTGLSVVIVPLLLLAIGRRPSVTELVGTGVATVGLVMLTDPGGGGSVLGEVLVLACAFAFALQLVALEHLGAGLDALRLTFVQLCVVAVAAVAACLVLRSPLIPSHGTTEAWITIGVDGVLASAVAFFAQTWALAHLASIEVAILYVLEPVFAAVAALVGLGDHLGLLVWAGGLAVVVAMALVGIGGREAPASQPGSPTEAAG